MHCREETFKFRNYDPETGTARKHARLDEEDTVEKQVEGLTDAAIAQDEAQRAQELVRALTMQPKARRDLRGRMLTLLLLLLLPLPAPLKPPALLCCSDYRI